MNADAMLDGIALIELTQRLGNDGVNAAGDMLTLADNSCRHFEVSLYLAAIVANISTATGFALQDMLDYERREALAQHGDPGGIA